MNINKILLFILTPLIILASEPNLFNLKYPTVIKESKLKQERYDLLQVYIKGEGYFPVYGRSWNQQFFYPKFKDLSYKTVVKDFVIKSLGIKTSDISKDNYGHFFIDYREYWLKLNVGSRDYEYTLLRVEDSPSVVKLDENEKYLYTKKFLKRYKDYKFPKAIIIPIVNSFEISKVNYKKYDKYTFWIGQKKHIYKGEFWDIDFEKTKNKDNNSYRYIVANDYKNKILELGGTILHYDKNEVVCKFDTKVETFYIRLHSYEATFSIQIIKQEAFKQTLVLSPYKIKVELDKSGKIVLDGIYFDFDKATLKAESKRAILSTVALMQKYPDLVLGVHGHTDAKGNDDYNLKLSGARANSVKKAILHEGIEPARLSSKGYGETRPIASNNTEEDMAKNRRVELHKISGGNKKSIITIDFIKPLPNSVVDSKYSYKNNYLDITYTKPYSDQREEKEYKGNLETISYKIMKGSKVDSSISRLEIIENYENILELYDAKIVGKYGSTLYFKIKDRGDGLSVYGLISGYTSGYSVKFLVVENKKKIKRN
ncbi:MAG: OmpA family protein [Sulfurimonas sp.]|jgi:outer membrane protein OmpA-like peptidoglycan-associated protein|nr:OmpA family protein [Sulfurimonas sp.]